MIEFHRLEEVRQRRPLIHCVSNIVTAGDCANLALAVGASPMMAHAPEEMTDITAISNATVLNTGTPDEIRFEVCAQCGKAANAAQTPVVLDPVGVGASPWRLRRVQELLHLFTPTILRVNLGEAQALSAGSGREQGVDSPQQADWEVRLTVAKALALRRHTTVLLSGPEDIVTDGQRSWCLPGGSDLMSSVTGTGCMLSVLCGVFAAAEPDGARAAVLASAFWKVCSSRAEEAAAGRGPGTFRTALMDAAGTLTTGEFAALAQIREL